MLCAIVYYGLQLIRWKNNLQKARAIDSVENSDRRTSPEN